MKSKKVLLDDADFLSEPPQIISTPDTVAHAGIHIRYRVITRLHGFWSISCLARIGSRMTRQAGMMFGFVPVIIFF